MEVIKNIRDLPEWFSIENYQYLNTASWMELCDQLRIRSYLKLVLECRQKRNHFKWSDLEGSFLMDWNQITEHGRVEQFHTSLFEYKERKNIKAHPYFKSRNIESLSMSDLQYLVMDQGLIDERLIMDSSLDVQTIEDSSYDYQWQQLNPDHNRLHLAINLSVPDSMILEEMKLILKQYREAAGVAEPPKDYLTPGKIIEQRIIPFIDLSIWADLMQVRIHNEVIGRALFPDGEKGEYEVRTAISANAEKALSAYFLIRLSSMAALKKDE